jgi:hypothetical protein
LATWRPEAATTTTPDVDKKQRGEVATREVEEHNKYLAALYARVFSALAADERHFSTLNADGGPSSRRLTSTLSDADEKSGFLTLAADKRLAAAEESKGFWAPDVNKKQQGDVTTREAPNVNERHFSTLNADKKSKGILARGPFDRGRTSQQRGRLRTTRRLNCRCNCLFFAIYCCCEVYRDLNYSAADEKSKFSTHDVDRSDTDEMSRRRRQEATQAIWGAIHQLLSIILKLRILVLLPVSTMPYVVMVKNYS